MLIVIVTAGMSVPSRESEREREEEIEDNLAVHISLY
jgi:hypothetical protein